MHSCDCLCQWNVLVVGNLVKTIKQNLQGHKFNVVEKRNWMYKIVGVHEKVVSQTVWKWKILHFAQNGHHHSPPHGSTLKACEIVNGWVHNIREHFVGTHFFCLPTLGIEVKIVAFLYKQQ